MNKLFNSTILTIVFALISVSMLAQDSVSTADAADASDYGDVIYVVTETMPEFPGGMQEMMRFINENIVYPVEAAQKGIQGRAICQFVVEKDGSISNVVVIRSSGDRDLDNEAIRVVQSMPQWKPGKQRGVPVRVKYTIPINFRLTDDKKQKPKE